MPRLTTLSPKVAHLVGPGKIKVVSGRLVFSTPTKRTVRLDAHRLRSVCCYGGISLSDEAIAVLLRKNIEVSFLTLTGGQCRGRLVSRRDSAASLRLHQYDVFGHPGHKLELTRWFVASKIDSQLQSLRHFQRHGAVAVSVWRERLQDRQRQCAQASTVDELRGIEGAATASWYQVFAEQLEDPWRFPGRRRRPATDPVNALISLGSTWLFQRALACLSARGLETHLGVLHEFRPGRPSLACDIIEPLRAPAVERWVLNLCNRQLVAPHAFRETDQGVRLQPDQFGRILLFWEQWIGELNQDRVLETLLNTIVGEIYSRSRAPKHDEVGETNVGDDEGYDECSDEQMRSPGDEFEEGSQDDLVDGFGDALARDES